MKSKDKKNQLELEFKCDKKDSVKSSKLETGKIIYLNKYPSNRESELINKIISLSNHIN